MTPENLCRLCFVSGNDTIEFFGEEGIRLNITNIVVQHFWFKIQPDDNLPIGICRICWKLVNEFHELYKNVEIVHKRCFVDDNDKCNNYLKNDDSNGSASINFTIIDADENDIDIYDDNDVVADDDNDVVADDDNDVVADDDNDGDGNDDNLIIKSEYTGHVDNETYCKNKNESSQMVASSVEIKLEKMDVTSDTTSTNSKRTHKIVAKFTRNRNGKSIKSQKRNTKNNDNVRKNSNKRKKISKNDSIPNENQMSSMSTYNSLNKEQQTEKVKQEIIDLNKEIICKQEEIYQEEEEEDRLNQGKSVLSDIIRRDEEDVKIREFFNLNCHMCETTLLTISQVRSHYRNEHNLKNGYITCCNKKLFRRCDLLEHMFWHSNPNEFKCNVCHKVYRNKYGLKIHMHFHSTPDERKYVCDICGDSFTVRYHLMRHFRVTHLTKIFKEFKCEQCNKSFRENSILQSHIRGVHQFKNVHICHICAKVYKSKAQCELHYLEHTNVNKPKVQCQICGALLKNELSLNCHLRRTHNGVPKTCKLCGKVAPHKNALQSHMRYVHAERIHKCNLCDKAFKKPIGLKEHMASHTGTSILYTCPYCPKTFNSNANMHSHRKKKHPTEWLQEKFKRSHGHTEIINPININLVI